MKKSPANININLVPRDPFFSTTFGRMLQWALSAGRYIVIFTELIVIVSFAARFTLDRQITDLNNQIFKSKSIIQSYGDLEANFRSVQTRLEDAKKIDQETNIMEVFASLSDVTPRDINLEQLGITPTSVLITGSTLSQASFNLLINNLQLSGKFFNINVGKIEAGEDNKAGYVFNIGADTKEVKKVTTDTTKSESINILDRTQGL